jgi:Mrp family chromosome partitioning ATPase
LLEELASRSDLVLIDSPPLLSVGDAAALFPKVDALIVVASRRILRRPILVELRRLLDASQTVRLGVVVTNTKMVSAGRYAPPAGSWQGGKTTKRDLAALQEPK